jgi:hypothetical protein
MYFGFAIILGIVLYIFKAMLDAQEEAKPKTEQFDK